MRALRRLFLNTFFLLLALALCGSGMSPTAHLPRPRPHASPRVVRTASLVPSLALGERAHPARLLIPAIGINALVESVGILPNGNMATPVKSPWDDVGWYSAGPLPGEQGSSVIDGHLDRPGGDPAVFWYLRDLHVGDKVIVVDALEKTWHFHVTRIMFYPPQNAPIEDIFGNNAGAFLNLVTCAGDWIPDQHQTTLRLVVFTTLDA